MEVESREAGTRPRGQPGREGGYLQAVLQHLAAVQEGGAGLAQVAQVYLQQTHTWGGGRELSAAAPPSRPPSESQCACSQLLQCSPPCVLELQILQPQSMPDSGLGQGMPGIFPCTLCRATT